MEEDLPFKDTPIKTAENAERINNVLSQINFHFGFLPNIWYYRDKILPKLLHSKKDLILQYNRLLPELEELIDKYKEWVKIE